MAYSKIKARKRGLRHMRMQLKVHKLNGETDKIRKTELKMELFMRKHKELH